ncbi:FecR domain-containing protein [Mucilaginibacter sabulilitoris]|uniref:FecR domain-containing protein n=1 Tax=Mucilaginibacter sabulilitoris TaxID=1173583 RepID=A0ABZ0TPE0_9SPHI|nr:FecR domain-containing protein [Mucilaginibacter sabulilitoris]WPU95009.1 FecR domain-containing protein [Mucilaginibacter sabulilitoris]
MKKQLHINDELLISYLLQEVSPEQATQVTEWRALNAENERRFEQFRLIWDSSKNFKADPDIDAYASLQQLKQRAVEQKTRHAKIVSLNNYTWLKIAAAVLFIAGSSWLYFNRFVDHQVKFETQELVKTDTLSDGSMITLNKYALLNYPEKFTGSQRMVTLLKGEAFFNVAHNKTKPFIITAGSTTIKVVGTSFNVINKKGIVEVIVETGVVQVSENGSMVLLKPGEKVWVQQASGKLVKETNPDKLYNYYRSKEFLANNVPLSRFVEVLNQAYDSHIIIKRKELNNLLVNSTFRTDDTLDNILTIVSRTFKITIEKEQNRIILK